MNGASQRTVHRSKLPLLKKKKQMRHNPIKTTISFTEQEHSYHSKRGALKKQTLWVLLQDEITKAFKNLEEVSDQELLVIAKKRKPITITLPTSLEKKIIHLANNLSLTPSQLIYRLIYAPHLPNVISETTQPEPVEPPVLK